MTTKIQYVSNQKGIITNVMVPIDLWEELTSEIETRFFLDNPVMKKRLLEARERTVRLTKDEVYEKLINKQLSVC